VVGSVCRVEGVFGCRLLVYGLVAHVRLEYKQSGCLGRMGCVDK